VNFSGKCGKKEITQRTELVSFTSKNASPSSEGEKTSEKSRRLALSFFRESLSGGESETAGGGEKSHKL